MPLHVLGDKKKFNGSASMSRRMAKCALNYFLIHQAWQRSRFGCLHASSTSCHSASKQINLINKEPRIVLSPKNTKYLEDADARCWECRERDHEWHSARRHSTNLQLNWVYVWTFSKLLLIEVFDEIKSKEFLLYFRRWPRLKLPLCKKSIQELLLKLRLLFFASLSP